ncbi:hypothetical protein BGX21_008537 [Mortierella sp. AD011]|nr:hypothetical protein BGX21_008537 [Mortierella sp. AD011]
MDMLESKIQQEMTKISEDKNNILAKRQDSPLTSVIFTITAFGRGNTMLEQERIFILASGLAILGAIFIWFFILNFSKHDLYQEDEEFKQYLIGNGYDVSYLAWRTKPGVVR